MKNKLQKRNLTKFDYKARKLGILGCILVVLTLAVMLPVSANLSSNNTTLTNEIRMLNNDVNDDKPIVIDQK